jgi:hypothetical protein
VITLTAAERAAFLKAVEPVLEKHRTRIPSPLDGGRMGWG